MDAIPMSTAAPMSSARDHCLVLHARFRRPLQRFFANYRLNAADIDDFTQEVFLRLLGLSRPQELRAPDAFVFTLARNLVRDRARRLQARADTATVPLDDRVLACARPTPDQTLEHSDRLHQALHALARLKADTRRAFYLNRIDGHSYAETALQMGVSVSMIEKHLMVAIAVLQDLR